MICSNKTLDRAASDSFYLACDAFEKAGRSAGGISELYFQMGDRVIRVRFAGSAMFNFIVPALEHLLIDPPQRADLTVCVFDDESTGVRIPPLPWRSDAPGAKNENVSFAGDHICLWHQLDADALHMMDLEQNLAIYWVRSPSGIPWWESSFPFRIIFQWWFRTQPLQLVHAGAVGFSEGGVLITGKKGCGKSTSTLACMDSGLFFAGDDYVLVQVDAHPRVHSLYNTVKIHPSNLRRFPDLKSDVANADRLDREKAMIFLGEKRPDKMIKSFPLKAILLPHVTGETDTRLRQVKAQESLKAIAPTTILQLQGAKQDTFIKICKLVRMVPSYVLEAGTDLAQIPGVIIDLLKSSA